MKGQKLFAVIIIVIVLILAGWALQGGFSANRTIFNQDYYEQMMVETNLSTSIHEHLQETILEEMSEEMPDHMAAVVTRVLLMVFTEEWFEEQTIMITDDFVRYVTGEQQSIQAVIDLREEKEELSTKLEMSLTVIPEQILRMLGFDPEELYLLAEALVEQMPLPDRLSVEQLLMEQEAGRDLLNLLSLARQFCSVYRYLTAAAFILGLLLLYFLTGPFGALKWFGLAAMLSGASFYMVLQGWNLLLPVMLELGLISGGLLETTAFYNVFEYSITLITIVPLYFALFGLAVLAAGFVSGRIFSRYKSR